MSYELFKGKVRNWSIGIVSYLLLFLLFTKAFPIVAHSSIAALLGRATLVVGFFFLAVICWKRLDTLKLSMAWCPVLLLWLIGSVSFIDRLVFSEPVLRSDAELMHWPPYLLFFSLALLTFLMINRNEPISNDGRFVRPLRAAWLAAMLSLLLCADYIAISFYSLFTFSPTGNRIYSALLFIRELISPVVGILRGPAVCADLGVFVVALIVARRRIQTPSVAM